ncbi:hypothetical protein AMC99_01875 [Altererythrobacter epoxidivorans]|uniref:DUF4350 domain-containing protein n=1 Tax=Altererythrobacter epoxidivorans TaxID=361183 RepID=A0A0M4MWL1_9SPHN|nr:hypothetical protein [Altererythrobacter epoxidivorans]ALE17163.1 hypothetical protein AMC99_01875 [Altererythrobacter epoxidivorans]
MPRRNRLVAALFVAVALAVGAYALFANGTLNEPDEQWAEREPMGLMTSLPIYWGEGADMATIASGDAPHPWMRGVIERHYLIQPLDALGADIDPSADAPPANPLAGMERLAIIQPRSISPADNAALDEWVRKGGKLLLVLDPMLSGRYDYSLGDPRHPTVSALIPPVMARWGLMMQYDDSQSFDVRMVDAVGDQIPTVMAGELLPFGEDGDEGRADCTIKPGGVVAVCTVGKGRATIVADAAMFEQPGSEGVGDDTILALLDAAFG